MLRSLRLRAFVICIMILTFSPRTGGALATLKGAEGTQTVRISVFSLFHPKELYLWAAENTTLELETGGGQRALSGSTKAVIRENGDLIQVRFSSESELTTMTTIRTKSLDQPSNFWLEVPGKLRRRYEGTLEIRSQGQTLEAVVTMPIETAVASIVEAESPPGAPLEALKAQAVAARSFLVARQTGHHVTEFDFCDTTHCQFLRSPPALGSPAAEATGATADLILTYHDAQTAEEKTLPAMYARSCGGRTRTLQQIGVRSRIGYPYYAVVCRYCVHHPELAQHTPTARHAVTERERLAWNRIHGWGSIPSLTGKGTGHGLGLCQLGAADMAKHGAGFAEILAHYYPNTQLATAQPR